MIYGSTNNMFFQSGLRSLPISNANGSYENEPETVALMDEYMKSQGYILDVTDERMHHEIYLSDVRKGGTG